MASESPLDPKPTRTVYRTPEEVDRQYTHCPDCRKVSPNGAICKSCKDTWAVVLTGG